MKNRGSVADAFLERPLGAKNEHRPLFPGPLRRPFSTKNRKNGIQKSIQKSMPKKYRKIMKQAPKMMRKWMPKSMIFDTFSKKAKRTKLLKKLIEFLGFGMQKDIKNQSKIYAKSMQEKGMQKVWKMMPKCIQNGSPNPLKIGKVMEKRQTENDVEILGQTNPSLRDFPGGLGYIFGGAGEGG